MIGTAPDVAKLLALAVAVTESAGCTARTMRVVGVSGVSTKTTSTDVVTAADRAVEAQAIAELRAARPGDAILGEESGSSGAGAVRWILDPIDGTVNYLYGLPNYAVSLAAELDGVVVAGVVHQPATGHTWTATRGGGAWRDGERLGGSPVTELGQALVGTGFGYDPARRAHQAGVLAQVLPRVRDIRRLGAAALDLCLAAEGRLDAYYERGLAPWDHAAGALIAAEAGLTVSGLGGAAAGPAMVVAAPPVLYQPLELLLRQLGADTGP